MEKTSEGTLKQAPNDGVRPNYNTPPLTRAQQPTMNATANAALIQETEGTESNDKDDENQQRIMSSLQHFWH